MQLLEFLSGHASAYAKVLWTKVYEAFLFKFLYTLNYHMYRLWLAIYGEPDHSDVIIFNEQPRSAPGTHTVPRCQKLYCESCRVQRLLLYINSAKVSIDIAQMTISHKNLYNAVIMAWNRGVQVRIVTDSQMVCVRGSVMMSLYELGVPVNVSPIRIMMHHKFCIIDGETRIRQLDLEEQSLSWHLWKRRGYVMTGSLNWTKQGTAYNFENVIITSNRKVAAVYQKLFDDLWELFQPLDLKDFFTQNITRTKNGKNVCE